MAQSGLNKVKEDKREAEENQRQVSNQCFYIWFIITPNLDEGMADSLFPILSLRFPDISRPEITPTSETGVDPKVCSQICFHCSM